MGARRSRGGRGRNKAGRPRRTGTRHPGGQLVRTPRIDKGTAETQARRAFYARGADPAQTIDPLGRLWCARLLNDDQRDAGRRFAVLYWRKLPNPNPISSLYSKMVPEDMRAMRPSERAAVGLAPLNLDALLEDADERDARQEEALLRMLKVIDRMGPKARAAFDDIVLDANYDHGPAWADRVIASQRPNAPAPSLQDVALLQLVRAALNALL